MSYFYIYPYYIDIILLYLLFIYILNNNKLFETRFTTKLISDSNGFKSYNIIRLINF
jgi:hypothetical protein